jgi:hypothetical protein
MHMIGKRTIMAIVVVAIVATTSGLVLARGFGGRSEGGGGGMWLLARAAGLDHDQIATAFQNDANLKTQKDNLKTAHDAMMACLVTAKDCTTQISSVSNALQAFSQERMTVWQNLFKNAPNPSQASKVYSQLQQLRSQKKQLMQSVFGTNRDTGGSSPATQSSEG